MKSIRPYAFQTFSFFSPLSSFQQLCSTLYDSYHEYVIAAHHLTRDKIARKGRENFLFAITQTSLPLCFFSLLESCVIVVIYITIYLVRKSAKKVESEERKKVIKWLIILFSLLTLLLHSSFTLLFSSALHKIWVKEFPCSRKRKWEWVFSFAIFISFFSSFRLSPFLMEHTN